MLKNIITITLLILSVYYPCVSNASSHFPECTLVVAPDGYGYGHITCKRRTQDVNIITNSSIKIAIPSTNFVLDKINNGKCTLHKVTMFPNDEIYYFCEEHYKKLYDNSFLLKKKEDGIISAIPYKNKKESVDINVKDKNEFIIGLEHFIFPADADSDSLDYVSSMIFYPIPAIDKNPSKQPRHYLLASQIVEFSMNSSSE